MAFISTLFLLGWGRAEYKPRVFFKLALADENTDIVGQFNGVSPGFFEDFLSFFEDFSGFFENFLKFFEGFLVFFFEVFLRVF